MPIKKGPHLLESLQLHDTDSNEEDILLLPALSVWLITHTPVLINIPYQIKGLVQNRSSLKIPKETKLPENFRMMI